MIRRSDIRLCWRPSIWCWLVIAIAGCSETSPDGTRVDANAPTAAKSAQDAIAGPVAEVVNADAPATAEETRRKAKQKTVETPRAASMPKKPKAALTVPERPEYVYEPRVLMTQRDADTCLVKAGEPFPAAQLLDLKNQEHSLTEFFGEKLTVIVFWSNENRLGREQIQRLEAETVLPFENMGLSVVAVNISDPPEQISDLLPADREVGFAILLDKNASLYSKVATERHPRTYLLDANGKVLWFDIEYSRSTTRDLANAINVHLGEGETGDS